MQESRTPIALPAPGSFRKTALAFLDKTKKAIASIGSASEATDKLAQAATLASYAQRIQADNETINAIQYGKLLCVAKLAELMPRGQGKRSDLTSGGAPLKLVSADALKRYRKVGDLSELIDKYYDAAKVDEHDTEMSIAGFLRYATPVAVAPIIKQATGKLPDGVFVSIQNIIDTGRKFSCIYADPPWQYGNQGTRAATNNHYPTMPLDDIIAEPVDQVAAENCHLHLWTTNAFLFDAKRVMESWGFTYKSVLVWVKPQMGIGNYWRVSHEFMLFGIRGRLPFRNRAQKSWMEENRTKHSRKPSEARRRIELVSTGPFLEMYGRERSPGWTVYGNEVSRSLFDAD